MDGVSGDYYGKVGRRPRNAAYRGLLATALQAHPRTVGFPVL